MDIPLVTLPRLVPLARERTPQGNVPQTRGEREKIKHLVAVYVEKNRPVPPLSLEELRDHAAQCARQHGIDAVYQDYLGVLLNNETWRESLAAVPYERRL